MPGEVEVLWAEEALCYVTEAPKECDVEYSVSEWLSDLRRHKISHEPFVVHLGQSSHPPLTARPHLCTWVKQLSLVLITLLMLPKYRKQASSPQ